MKILSPFAHGLLDFVVVLSFALAPTLLAFSPTPTAISYVLAAVHLAMTLATAFPLGLIKLIPFPVHGVLEFCAAVAVLLMPWLAGFAVELPARNFYLGAGVVIVAVVAVTDYRGLATQRARVPQGAHVVH